MDQPTKTSQLPEMASGKSTENQSSPPTAETTKPMAESVEKPAVKPEAQKETARPEAEVEILPLAVEERDKIRQEILQEIERAERAPAAAPPVVRKTAVQPPVMAAKSPELLKVEKILEEDLDSFYYKMDPSFQARFKAKGEQTAVEIEQLLRKTKVKAKEILRLLIAWLKMIPGVNRFFIQQEAKIKTNKLLNLPKQQP